MKKALLILVAILCFVSCSPEDDFPSLRVVNESEKEVIYVSLVGYEFENLGISTSQTFNLDSGMQGGYDNINIKVRLSGPQIVIRNIKVNFNDGETTTITVKGCISSEGCDGYWLE